VLDVDQGRYPTLRITHLDVWNDDAPWTNLTIDIDLTAGFNPTSLEQVEALPGYGQYQY
jgi:hypothetical protein